MQNIKLSDIKVSLHKQGKQLKKCNFRLNGKAAYRVYNEDGYSTHTLDSLKTGFLLGTL